MNTKNREGRSLFNQMRRPALIAACLLLGSFAAQAQNRNLTAAVLINSTNSAGYNTSSANPGEFQRYTERYLHHLQIPYQLFDVSSTAPPVDLSSRQLIVAGHRQLTLSTAWRDAIVNSVNSGVGFINLDSATNIGSQSHMATMFGATGTSVGSPSTQISIPSAVAPGGASPHYIAALQKKFDDPSGTLTYSFHADDNGVVQTASSTILQNASGTVIARLGSDPLILAKTYGSGRAVHFGTLDYLNADRFGFTMGLDDVFWRSLVWAARKPFVVRGYPRLWAVQMDDTYAGWGTRVRDLYDPAYTGSVSADGTGGPWKVTGFVFTDNVAPGSVDRTNVIADINAGKLEVTPHSFGDVMCGNMYWNNCTGALTDAAWQANVNAISAWKQGNGGSDTIPSFSRSFVAHFWNLSNNTGYDLWNQFGFRYMTSIQKPGFQSTDANHGAERLPALSFWNYKMPPKSGMNGGLNTEDYPFFFADEYTVGSRTGLPSQTFFLFATQYLDFAKYPRPDFTWPNAWPTSQTVNTSVAQLQQYTWRHWSSLDPVQVFTHDAINYDNSTVEDRRSVITQSSSWLGENGVKHVFMDDLGDYVYARAKSTLTQAQLSSGQITYTFTGKSANADGNLIQTQLLVFTGDNEGVWQNVPGFTGGLTVARDLPPSVSSISPVSGPPAGGTTVTITGSGFIAGSSVIFGTNSATSVTFVNGSTLQAVSPAGPASTVDIKVITANGTAVLPGAFTYIPPPPSCPCTVWNSGTTPTTVDSGATTPYELGVKFRSDFNGYITSLRFYKSAANTGTHIAHLWSSSGSLLASATFVGETASGWQQVDFASPVPVTAGTTYVASYYAPNGHYSVTLGGFLTAGIDNSPLHVLKDGVDGGNGIYAAGSSAFPTSTYQSSNYWVDVVFNTVPLAPGPVVISTSPVSGATGVGTGATIRASFNKALNPSTVNTTTFRLLDSGNNPVAASVSYNAADFTATLTPTAALSLSSSYTATLTGGASGIKDTTGSPLASNVSWSFTTSATPPQVCPCSVWDSSATPGTIDSGVGVPFELGVKFRSDQSGYISSLRFYKSALNTGTHVAHLWSSSGTLLASATFANETSSGWQQVDFASPVPVTAGATYVASYFAPNGHYSVDLNYFASTGVDNAPLHLLRDGEFGGNGVYTEGATAFPDQTYLASNYWVDVVFSTSAAGPGPQVTSTSPTAGATGVSPGVPVTASFNKALDPLTVTTSTIRLLDASNNPISATVSYNSTNFVTTLMPVAPLNLATTYTAVVKGGSAGVKDTTGSPMAADFSWSFSTSTTPPQTCPCSVFDLSAVPGTIDSNVGTPFELGVKFRSDIDGYITGLRFYKSAANIGTHVGHLWSSTGTVLATATFTDETASGWQQVTFDSPVPITAGVTYVASYFAPNGHYSVDLNYFASSSADNAPLHFLKDGVDGPNGVFAENVSAFPTGTYLASNYWVDVVFATSLPATLSSVAVNPTTVKGGTSATGTVTLSAAAPAGGATVALASNNAAAVVPSQVTVAQGSLTATFAISTTAVGSSTAVTITGTYVVAKTATLTVTPPTVSTVTLNPTSVSAGASSAGTVTLDSPAPVGGAVVALSSSNTSAASVPASVTVAQGATTANFTTTTSSGVPSTSVTITASFNGSKTASLSINGITASNLTVNPTSVVSGASSTGRVTLSSAAPAGGIVVTLSSANSAVAAVPATVTVASGATTAQFTVTTSGVSSNTTVAISATLGGVTRNANLTVTPATLLSVSINPTTVNGGTPSTGTLTLSGAAPSGGAVVALSDTNSASSVPSSVTIPAGASTATFTITTTTTLFTRTGRVSGTYRGTTRNSQTLTVRGILF